LLTNQNIAENTKNKMNNTQQISDIIFEVFEDYVPGHSLTMTLSERAAQKLVLASLQQLADLMGGELDYDADDQVIISTGVSHALTTANKRRNLFATDNNVHPTEVP